MVHTSTVLWVPRQGLLGLRLQGETLPQRTQAQSDEGDTHKPPLPFTWTLVVVFKILLVGGWLEDLEMVSNVHQCILETCSFLTFQTEARAVCGQRKMDKSWDSFLKVVFVVLTLTFA